MPIVPATVDANKSIADQIPYKAGKYTVSCPNCGRGARVVVLAMRGHQHPVRMNCKHCGTACQFNW